MVESVYLSVVETARLIRKVLARSFPVEQWPALKFSVRSDSYAGGAGIDIRWTDGPTTKMVDAVVGGFRGGRFDGMIDMAYSVSSWLLPDGSAMVAHNPGTGGQKGLDPGEDNPAPPGAKLVHFGADHVFTYRRYSESFVRRFLASWQATHAGYGDVTVRPPTEFSGAELVEPVGMCRDDYVRMHSALASRVTVRAVKLALMNASAPSNGTRPPP